MIYGTIKAYPKYQSNTQVHKNVTHNIFVPNVRQLSLKIRSLDYYDLKHTR